MEIKDCKQGTVVSLNPDKTTSGYHSMYGHIIGFQTELITNKLRVKVLWQDESTSSFLPSWIDRV